MAKDETILDEARGAMLARLRDPLVLGFTLGFLSWNWRFFYVLLLHDRPVVDTIHLANDQLTVSSYVVPLIVALSWAFVLPFISSFGFGARYYAGFRLKNWRKKLHEREALSPAEWRARPENQLLERRKGAFEKAICVAWKQCWPVQNDVDPEASVRIFECELRARQVVLRDGSHVKALEPGDLIGRNRLRLNYLFDSYPDAKIAVGVDAGGLAPWPSDHDAHLIYVMLDGQLEARTEAGIPKNALGQLVRCTAPHDQWGRFDIFLPKGVLRESSGGEPPKLPA